MSLSRRTATASVVIAVAAVPLLVSPAHAAPTGTGCQRGFQLTSVEEVLTVATPGFEEAIKAEDANGDGFLCFKLLPSAIPLFEPTFLYYDNDIAGQLR